MQILADANPLRMAPNFPRTAARAAAALPFVLALLFSGFGARARHAAKGPERPALVFDQYLVNLGKVPPAKFAAARFAFINTSQREVTIRQLNPSCGCLKPRLEKRTYSPGERGEFRLRVETPNEKPGPKEYFLNIVYEDPKPREVQLVFKVALPKQVRIRPSALVFYQLGSEPTSRDVVVGDYRSEPLTVTGVDCDSPLVSTKLGDTVVDEHEIQHTLLTVTVSGRVPPKAQSVNVIIHTDDPEYPTLTLPLHIQGSPADTRELPRQASSLPSTAPPPRVTR